MRITWRRVVSPFHNCIILKGRGSSLDLLPSKKTFNKLHKDGNNVYEKIGNCQNKNYWLVKEFLNTVLEKEYNTPYDNNNFTNTIIDAINNIHETSVENKLIK